MNNFAERIAESSAHVEVLPLAELSASNYTKAVEFDAGVYFLWLGDKLQYIGKSRDIPDRINRHLRYLNHGRFTLTKWQNAIPFDRYTFILVANSRMRFPDIDQKLQDLERAYITAYPTPYNPNEYSYNT